MWKGWVKIKIIFIMMSILLILKDTVLILSNFQNKFFKYLDIIFSIAVSVFNIIIIWALVEISSKKIFELGILQFFLIILIVLSLVKIIYVYMIGDRRGLKVFITIIYELMILYLIYISLNMD